MTHLWKFRLRIAGPVETPETFELLPGTMTIGREGDNSLALRHNMVSRHHATIECTSEGKCYIVDEKSTNGTLVNGTLLTRNAPMALAAGALIVIGPFKLTLEQIPLAPQEEPQRPSDQAPAPMPVIPSAAPELQPAAPRVAPQPPSPPPPPIGHDESVTKSPWETDGYMLPGLTLHSQRLLHYLPDIYQPPCDDSNDATVCFSNADYSPQRFLSRFLAMFESILLPIEWTVDNFDLFLHPGTAPAGFLNWLANWFGITWDESWTDQQRRTLLREAHRIYARRGTRWALSRMVEIYLGQPPVVVDDAQGQAPYTFDVLLSMNDDPARRASIEAIIDAHKPAHTTYTLRFEHK